MLFHASADEQVLALVDRRFYEPMLIAHLDEGSELTGSEV